jgi:hypothetical protein
MSKVGVLTFRLETVHNVPQQLDLVRLEKHQSRLPDLVPLEVHQVAALKVLPVGQEHDGAVVNLLDEAGERILEVSIPSLLQ